MEEHKCSYLNLNLLVVGKFDTWACDVCGKEHSLTRVAGDRGLGGFARGVTTSKPFIIHDHEKGCEVCKSSEHFCPYNDPPQSCACYDAGYEAGEKVEITGEAVKTTKVKSIDYDEIYCEWFDCLNCDYGYILDDTKYCGGCGLLINWE